MSLLEFTAKVKDGQIEVPPEYLETLTQVETVRVTVDTPQQTACIGMISELIEHPLATENFTPLTREEAHER